MQPIVTDLPNTPDTLSHITHHATRIIQLTDLTGVLVNVRGEETLLEIPPTNTAAAYLLIPLAVPLPTSGTSP